MTMLNVSVWIDWVKPGKAPEKIIDRTKKLVKFNASNFENKTPEILEIYQYWCNISASLSILLNLIAFALIVLKWKIGRIHTTKYFINIQVTHLFFAVSTFFEGVRITRLELLLNNSFILVLFITMICSNVDRYLAICHPFHYQKIITTKKTLGLIVTSWILAIIFILNMHFQKYKRHGNFLILSISTTSVLSLSIAVLTYSNIAIWFVAKRHVSCIARTSVDTNKKEMIRRKQLRKSTLTCILMVTSFVIFWSPFYIRMLTAIVNPKSTRWGNSMSRISIMLIHLNPISDPIIFVLVNKHLRKTIKQIWKGNRYVIDESANSDTNNDSK